jgi:hypothetical protein
MIKGTFRFRDGVLKYCPWTTTPELRTTLPATRKTKISPMAYNRKEVSGAGREGIRRN